MARKTLHLTIPAWTANLLPNLLGVAGLAAVCVMIAFLTNWRWGGLAGGVVAFGLSVWMQWSGVEQAQPAAVTSIKKAA